MKKLLYTLALSLAAYGFAYAQKGKDIKVAIDLNNVQDDKVVVTITPPAFDSETTTFVIPKIVPGTYS